MTHLIALYLGKVVKVSSKKLRTLETLRLRKNVLRIVPQSYEGFLRASGCAWAKASLDQLKADFRAKFSESLYLRLNNPKKGHITKRKEGPFSYEDFRRYFIDRMYKRK